MSLIRKKTEVELPKTIVGCIYGTPGIGKTTLALSAPKPLLIDTDRGCHRVQSEYRSDVVQVQSYQDILDVLEEDLSDYETIVIDTLGELVNFMLKYFSDKDKALITRGGTYNIKIWGFIKQEFQNLKMKLQALNKNLIFVSHQAEDKDGETKVFRMDVAGSTSKDIIKILDFLGYCEMLGKTRSINFSPSARFYAKNSIQLTDYIEIPTLNPGDANDFLTREIIEPTIQRRKEESKLVKAQDDLLEQGRKIIKSTLTPNDALAEIKKIKGLTTHAKMTLFEEIKATTTMKYNEEKGVFE